MAVRVSFCPAFALASAAATSLAFAAALGRVDAGLTARRSLGDAP